MEAVLLLMILVGLPLLDFVQPMPQPIYRSSSTATGLLRLSDLQARLNHQEGILYGSFGVTNKSPSTRVSLIYRVKMLHVTTLAAGQIVLLPHTSKRLYFREPISTIGFNGGFEIIQAYLYRDSQWLASAQIGLMLPSPLMIPSMIMVGLIAIALLIKTAYYWRSNRWLLVVWGAVWLLAWGLWLPVLLGTVPGFWGM